MLDEAREKELGEVKEAEVKLEASVQEGLDKIFDGDSTPTDDKPEDKPDDSAADESGKSEDSTPTGDKPDDDKSDDDKPEAEESDKPEDSTPTDDKPEDKPDDSAAGEPKGVSDAYYRAATHQGWKEDEIKSFYEANPELANRTFAKLLESTNTLSQEFAAIGRKKQEQAQQQQQQQQVAQPAAKKDDQQESGFKGVDIEDLRKKYDDDPIVDVIDQLQQQNKLLSDKVDSQPVQGVQTSEDELRVKLQQEDVVNQQVAQYFKTDDLKPYNEFYGEIPKDSKGWDGLTTAQKQNRWAVLELAEQILTGAEMQGRKMDVDEALDSAHLIVSEPIREKIIRNEIKSKVVKRGSGLTLKPNSGNVSASSTGPASQAAFEEKTTERLRKVFR